MHRVAVDSYCEQYGHNYWIHYFIRCFSLVVIHHQEYKYNKTVKEKLRMQFESIRIALRHTEHYVLNSSKRNRSGVGNLFTHRPHVLCIIVGRPRNQINFILKFYLSLKSDFPWVTKYLLITELCFDTMLCLT